jgi:K+-transporting ATPase A subunit
VIDARYRRTAHFEFFEKLRQFYMDFFGPRKVVALAHAIPILAIAGSLAAKNKTVASPGTLPTDGPPFIDFLLSVIAVIRLLQYLPGLALGPIAEHFLLQQGTVF